jgi:hypothetical protein
MGEWQPNSKRKLSPEEKRAPRTIRWRFDRAETFAGITVSVVLLVVGGWCVGVLTRSHEIGWREDGIIVEVIGLQDTPRPEVTSVSARRESYPWARQPRNAGVGPCADPRFRINGMPERERTYVATDVVGIDIQVRAAGCSDVMATFVGRFEKGSPWYNQVCPNGCETEYVDGIVHSRSTPLEDGQQTVTLIAEPGLEREPEPSSPPGSPVSPLPSSVEGMRLCSIELVVTDGVQGGSRSSQEVFVDCEEAASYEFIP